MLLFKHNKLKIENLRNTVHLIFWKKIWLVPARESLSAQVLPPVLSPKDLPVQVSNLNCKSTLAFGKH